MFHPSAQHPGDVAREPQTGVGAPAKQQAAIIRQAKVIHHMFAVAHGNVARQHVGGARAQGSGGDHEAVDRQNPGGIFAKQMR